MGEKLIVGPVNKGLRTDREPFVIDNDSFPVIQNAYQWRGRLFRKRGTQLIGQLQRYIGSTDGSGNATITINPHPLTAGISSFVVGTNVFYDPGGSGTVTLLTNGPGSATLTYSTGVLSITGSNALTPIIYYPTLPVMGLEETRLTPTVAPGTLGFDTTYSYSIGQSEPFNIHDVSFYWNPASGIYPLYVQKNPDWTPLWWNGQNYQQFWTANYAGALWATNGVTVPFTTTNIGMQYAGPSTTPQLSTAARVDSTTMQFTITGNTLVVGDFVFANEFTGMGTAGLNFQTGYVITAGNTITVKFPNATIANATYTPGILQYLTNRSSNTKDNIRWYNGDPTNGATPPVFSNAAGWVNYMPPLSEGAFSIGGLPAAQYYLVGAKAILPFKDRLVFFGPVLQSSSGIPQYLQDTIVFSQVGTPYYTASYTNSPSPTVDTPTSATILFNPILVPSGQTATSPAMFEDQVGFGGFISAGLEDAITTIGANEDAIIVGFTRSQTRLMSTGDGITPFEFFTTNSELGSASTFSSIVMDQGVITKGNRGYIISSQTGTQRIDLEIPDQVFEVDLDNNGNERFTAQRDFINEWIYFTYPSNTYETTNNNFPNETLFYNYRDNSYAVFYESFTTYGPFTISSGEVWSDLNYFTWEEWNDPWNSGDQLTNQPNVIAGNQQGFVFIRKDDATVEATSLSIQNISSGVVSSPNHGLNNGDFITISGALGTIATAVNGKVFQVANGTTTQFNLLPNPGSGTYEGGGYITRMYVPFIQTKQFPTAWGLARKVRLGPQQYLLSKTNTGQITVQIFISQDAANSYNDGPIVPQPGSINNSLIYSQIVYTCVESTNLGLSPANITAANTNLQMLAYPQVGISPSAQIWHRMNTSLIGDTVQLAFTLNAEQMTDPNLYLQFAEIELHAFILDVSPSMLLA